MGFVLVLGGAIAALVLTGFGRPSNTAVALFADAYAVPITVESRPLVERYIRGSRRLRMVGVVISCAVVVALLVFTDGSVNATFVVGVGYGLGAVLYELLRRPPGPGGAALTRRTIDDYINPWFTRLLVLTAIVGLFVYVLSFAFEPRPDQTPSIEVVAYRTIGGLSLLGLGLALLAARRIVRAPQPVISPPVDAAQHAIRTAGLVSLVGLALMAAGIVSIGAVEVGRSDAPARFGDVVSLVGVPLSFVSSVVGFFLTIRSLPRFAPFWRRLPDIPAAETTP